LSVTDKFYRKRNVAFNVRNFFALRDSYKELIETGDRLVSQNEILGILGK
jgi:hypothetical protein